MIQSDSQSLDARAYFDLGHQGDVDRTQIDKLHRMTPTERLRHHECWRHFLKRSSTMENFVESMVARLSRAQVEFLIVGGASAVLHGVSIVTMDLDICYRRTPENIARLVAVLGPLNPRPRNFPADLPFTFDERTLTLGTNFTLDIGVESLDLLGDMSAIGGYEQVIGGAEEMTVAGFTVKVLGLEQLIATKEAAGRPKDVAALPELRAALEIKRQRNSG